MGRDVWDSLQLRRKSKCSYLKLIKKSLHCHSALIKLRSNMVAPIEAKKILAALAPNNMQRIETKVFLAALAPKNIQP